MMRVSGIASQHTQLSKHRGRAHISDLKLGDMVASVDALGNMFYDEVWMFGHADPNAFGKFVHIRAMSDGNAARDIELSPSHWIPTCKEQDHSSCSWSTRVELRADHVAVGDVIWGMVDGTARTFVVNTVSERVSRGLYNPHTMGGNIIVDAVAASAYSSWVFDCLVPEQYVPAMYQIMFTPARALYKLLKMTVGMTGVESVCGFIDVNNPTSSPVVLHDLSDLSQPLACVTTLALGCVLLARKSIF